MRRAPRSNTATLILAALANLVAGAASADPSAADLRRQIEDTEHNRAAHLQAQRDAAERARAAQEAAAKLAADRVAASAALRVTEDALQQAAARMDDLSRRKREAEASLQARAAELSPLLPLIERLGNYPTETLLAVPEPPEQALRGALVLRGLTAELEREAARLRANQAEIDRLSQDIVAATPALQQAQADQARQAAALDAALAASRATGKAAEDQAADVARRAAAEAAHAANLRGALADLLAAQQAAEARAREATARAERAHRDEEAAAAQRRQEALANPGPGLPSPGLPTPVSAGGAEMRAGSPVAGRVIRAFGEPTEAGPANGISLEPAPGARVSAPCAGRVAFAGPFRSFGLLLILDCGMSYHFVLAGLDRLDVEVGHPVQTGEPVGVMANWDPRAPGPRPALYVELRRGGQAVDPAPWLRGRGS